MQLGKTSSVNSTESSANHDLQLCNLLHRWQVALKNSNCDDWRLAINFYDFLEKENIPMPEFVTKVFKNAKNIDLKSFAQCQEKTAATTLCQISTIQNLNLLLKR